jgi:glycine/D-amino acid oxidase-like deaminating enzyme
MAKPQECPMLGNPFSHGLWEMTAPAAPATQPLNGTHKADVVIIGGGYTGISAALHLAEAGQRAVVLEAHEIGFGGAGRNVGLVNAGMWVMPDTLVETLGSERGEALLTLLGEGPRKVFEIIAKHQIACEAVDRGTLHCGVGTAGLKELESRAEQWQRRGASVELLDRGATAQKVGSEAYVGALLDRRAGTIQPLAYVRGLAKAAIAAGAVIFTGSSARSCEKRGTGFFVSTEKGTVEASHVIVATDAYGDGEWAAFRREQMALPYFNLATRPLSPEMQASILPERQGAWDTKSILSSFRFDAAGRLVFGSVGALRAGGQTVHRAWAKRAMKKLFPGIGPIEFEAEWYGRIGMTTDNLPRFHRLAPNMVTICGYNGRGIAPGTVFGRCLADLTLGRMRDEECALPLSEPETIAFRPLREATLELGATLAHAVG